MDILPIFLILGIIAALWYTSLQARENAIAVARAFCKRQGVLLLDDTVALSKVSLCRDEHNKLRLCRQYTFDYAEEGDDRHKGYMELTGARTGYIHLDNTYHLY